jgi:hypothetical protein
MTFEEKFNQFIPELTQALTIPNHKDWTVKGFIDYYQNIYSISSDTKVISKIIELMIFPKFLAFAQSNNMTLKLSPHQNYYPDISFIDSDNKKYAVDLKSTYRITPNKVNGMTLGAFTGYFRNRESFKNTLYPYNHYDKHFVFGILYSRTDITLVTEYLKTLNITLTNSSRKNVIAYINENSDEKWDILVSCFQKDIALNATHKNIINDILINETSTYTLDNFKNIKSVVQDFDFFLQEKWKIAIDRPGSGNTKNIGSENDINILKTGQGLFYRKFGTDGKNIFDTYWTNYETNDMARSSGRNNPLFKNIETYMQWVQSLKT